MHLTRAIRHAGRSIAILFSATLLLACAHARAQVPPPAGTIGEQKTALILVNFTDAAVQPKSRTELHNLVFGEVSDFYWENSYQKTFLSGDTFGWATIPVTTTQCNWDLIVQEGDRAAVAAGANLAAYKQFVYLYPKASGCPVGGGYKTGANGAKRVFINGDSGFTLAVIAHEMGHGFGLNHSDALDCNLTPLGDTCSKVGYGDAADTMAGQGHFNAFNKERLGWLGATGAPPITTVSNSGRYAIDRYETMGTAPKALKILKGVDPVSGLKTWYYLEYRQPIGFDAVLAGRGNITSGVLVRTGLLNNSLGTSLQLDMTPNSNSFVTYEFQDGALDVGRSFTDTAGGVTITVAAADANGATIDVSFGSAPPASTCTRAAPTLGLSGATTAVTAGSTVSYTLSLTNRDSSACAATSFNLARSIPSGWTGTLTASTLSLSPGASGSTTLTVTSPAAASAGSYGVGTGASSSIGGTHTANASTTYSVASAPASGTLTATAGTDKTSYLRGQTVYMSTLVKNNGVAVTGASVNFNLTVPGGIVVVQTAVSGSDGYARSSYRLGKGKGAVGNYTLRADAASGSSAANASAGFNVN